MKHLIKATSVLLILTILTSLCSCSLFFFDNARFEGGRLLDDELMDEIRRKIFDTEASVAATDGETNNTHATDSSAPISSEYESAESSIELTSDSAETNAYSESDDPTETAVYWTEGGSVWHASSACSYLKNSQNVISGTLEEAINAGKERLCSACGKNSN